MKRGIVLVEGELGRAVEEAKEVKRVFKIMVANTIRKKEKEKVDFFISKEEEGGCGWFKFLRGDQGSEEEKIRKLVINGNRRGGTSEGWN